jgi:hypothetical protein
VAPNSLSSSLLRPTAAEATASKLRQSKSLSARWPLAKRPYDFILVTATLPVVLPAEAEVSPIDVEQATVGDCDTVGVARQIGQELLGTGEGDACSQVNRIDSVYGDRNLMCTCAPPAA